MEEKYNSLCNIPSDINEHLPILCLNDLIKCDIDEILNETKYLPIEVTYQWKNNLELELTSNYDMIFIDTWHVYGHLKRELAKFRA